MSELEHCRMAYEGKINDLKEKIDSNHFENLIDKKDQVKTYYLKYITFGFKFLHSRDAQLFIGLVLVERKKLSTFWLITMI